MNETVSDFLKYFEDNREKIIEITLPNGYWIQTNLHFIEDLVKVVYQQMITDDFDIN